MGEYHPLLRDLEPRSARQTVFATSSTRPWSLYKFTQEDEMYDCACDADTCLKMFRIRCARGHGSFAIVIPTFGDLLSSWTISWLRLLTTVTMCHFV